METGEQGTGEITPRNIQEAYLQIIGFDRLPKTPETMPLKVHFTPVALGSLEQAIFLTNADNTERSQVVSYDERRGFVAGKLFLGTKEGTGRIKSFRDLAHLWLLKKGFLDFHTHPHGVREFSFNDIRSFLITRNAYVYLVGSGSGVNALLQTEYVAKWPISSILSTILLHRKYDGYLIKGQEELDKLSPEDMEKAFLEWKIKHDRDFVSLLESEGLAYYQWLPESGIVKPDDFKNGLELIRVKGYN